MSGRPVMEDAKKSSITGSCLGVLSLENPRAPPDG
jgi:hypothetical protein